MTAIALNRVTISIGNRRILSDVTLTIEDGEFVGVLGPNGAGKTTMMRAILGLVPAQTGTIRVLGETARRGNTAVGYLPQNASSRGGHPAHRLGIRGRRRQRPSLGLALSRSQGA